MVQESRENNNMAGDGYYAKGTCSSVESVCVVKFCHATPLFHCLAP